MMKKTLFFLTVTADLPDTARPASFQSGLHRLR